MPLIEDQVRVARDSFLSNVCLIGGIVCLVVLFNTGHPAAAVMSILITLAGLYFFVDYLIVGHRLSRREDGN